MGVSIGVVVGVSLIIAEDGRSGKKGIGRKRGKWEGGRAIIAMLISLTIKVEFIR